MKTKITDIVITRHQRGWRAEIHYEVQTPHQFTAECRSVRGESNLNQVGLRGCLLACWRAYHAMNADAAFAMNPQRAV